MVSTFSARGVRETRRVRPPSRSSFSQHIVLERSPLGRQLLELSVLMARRRPLLAADLSAGVARQSLLGGSHDLLAPFVVEVLSGALLAGQDSKRLFPARAFHHDLEPLLVRVHALCSSFEAPGSDFC